MGGRGGCLADKQISTKQIAESTIRVSFGTKLSSLAFPKLKRLPDESLKRTILRVSSSEAHKTRKRPGASAMVTARTDT